MEFAQVMGGVAQALSFLDVTSCVCSWEDTLCFALGGSEPSGCHTDTQLHHPRNSPRGVQFALLSLPAAVRAVARWPSDAAKLCTGRNICTALLRCALWSVP